MDGEVTFWGRGLERVRVGGLLLVLAVAGCGDRREAAARAAFRLADRDASGFLTAAEYEATAAESSPEDDAQDFEQADEDRDGQLSFEEFRSTLSGPGPYLWALGIFSAVSFVGSLLAIPIVVARLPVDHFVAPHEAADWVNSSAARRAWLVLKNVLGFLLVVGGVMMLVLPGQGVLTILLGVAVMDLPGKWRLMRALARRPHVMKALNWMRERAEKPPLIPPPKKGETHREISMLSGEGTPPGA